MRFPDYVHSVIDSPDEAAWPVQGQGENECGCTVAANVLNMLAGSRQFSKDDFVREAGIFFQRWMGGSASPVTGWLIRRHGRGTHFGNLLLSDAEVVLRDLIDRQVPVVVEIGKHNLPHLPIHIYGEHSILLVGYSVAHPDRAGVLHQEYYFVDSQAQGFNTIDLHANDFDVDKVPTPLPGNSTLAREDFLSQFQTGIYYPVFAAQAAHEEWYQAHMSKRSGIPLLSWVTEALLTGSYDVWKGVSPA
jgi:peptidase C39-like protein